MLTKTRKPTNGLEHVASGRLSPKKQENLPIAWSMLRAAMLRLVATHFVMDCVSDCRRLVRVPTSLLSKKETCSACVCVCVCMCVCACACLCAFGCRCMYCVPVKVRWRCLPPNWRSQAHSVACEHVSEIAHSNSQASLSCGISCPDAQNNACKHEGTLIS